MEQNLQTIQFEITSDDSKAINSLEKVINTLESLKQVCTKAFSNNLHGIAKGIDDICNSANKIDTDSLSKLSSLSDSLKDLSTVKGTGLRGDSVKNLKDVSEAINNLPKDTNSKLNDLSKGLNNVNDSLANSDSTSPLQNVKEMAGQGVPNVKTANINKDLFVTKNVLKGIGGVAKFSFTVAKDTFNVLKKITSLSIKLGSVVNDRLFSGLKDLQEQIKKFKRSIGRIILYRAIRRVIKNIASGFKEGLQDLYQYSKTVGTELAKNLDNMATSSRYMRNSFVAMAEPLINVLAPALDFIVAKVVEVMNAFNKLFSLISGRGYWTQAIKQPVAYGSSIEKAGKKAKKVQEEVKKTIFSFDELHLMAKQDNKLDSNSGGGGTSEQYKDMFKQVPIANEWKKLLDGSDWSELGRTVAKKLNVIIRSMDDWINNVFRPYGKLWATRLATFLNGFIEALDWELLGKTFADGINACFDIVNTFLTTFDFDQWGQAIGRGLNSMLYHIEWDLIGETFANKLNGLIHTLDGFFKRLVLHAKQHGRNFGVAMNSFFDTVDFDSLADVLINGVKSLSDIIEGFNDEVDWDGITNELQDCLEKVIKNIDIQKLVKNISDLFVNITNTLASLPWDEIGYEIGKALASIDWKTVIKNVISIIGNLFVGGFKGLFSEGNGRVFVALVAGMEALKLAFKTPNLPLVAKGIVNGVSTAFSLLSGLFTPQGLLIAGIVVGVALIIKNWDKIKEWTNEHVEKIKEKFEKLGEVFSPVGDFCDNVKQGASNFVDRCNEMKDWTMEHVDNIKNKFKSWFNQFGESGDIQTVHAGLDGYQTKMDEVTANTDTCSNRIKGMFKGLFEKTSEHFANIKKSISDNMNQAKNSATTDGSSLSSSLTSTFTALASSVKSTFDGIVSSIQSALSSAISSARSAIAEAKSMASELAQDIGEATMPNFENGKFDFHQPRTQNLTSKYERSSRPTLPKVHYRANGGTVDKGDFFIARENGAEFVGRMGNQTAVANNEQIVDGIRRGIQDANQEEIRLLKEQNNLLLGILQKETGISINSVTDALEQKNRRDGSTYVPVG